ncbi:HD domain-containing protein [Candidatus Poribacteria bacterium]|nr:HD domain-containing protein [Candidatus Poribacteria bacterium]
MKNLKSRLIKRMREYFGEDEKRIRHALRVTKYAERILQYEKNADRDIVLTAAILHDIGIHEAERKYGSSAGKYQEREGPSIAREILLKEELPEELVEKICQIIAHHHTPGIVDTNNFRIVYDADLIVNLEDKELSRGKFLTEGGKKVAAVIF